MAKKKFSIDEGFSQLDDILKNLEQEDIKLADAVELYTKGVSTCLLYTSPSPRDRIRTKRREQ